MLSVVEEEVENSNQYSCETDRNMDHRVGVVGVVAAPLKIFSADDLKQKQVKESQQLA